MNVGGAPGGGTKVGGGYAGGGGSGASLRLPQRDGRLGGSEGRELDTDACIDDEILPVGGRGGGLAFGPAGFFLKSLMSLSMLL